MCKAAKTWRTQSGSFRRSHYHVNFRGDTFRQNGGAISQSDATLYSVTSFISKRHFMLISSQSCTGMLPKVISEVVSVLHSFTLNEQCLQYNARVQLVILWPLCFTELSVLCWCERGRKKSASQAGSFEMLLFPPQMHSAIFAQALTRYLK